MNHVKKPTEAASTDRDARRKAARARQEVILQKFSAQQQSLLANLEEELGSDDEVDEENSFGTCILCQEHLDHTRTFGTLVHVQTSRLVRTSVPRDAAALSDVLATPLNLDRLAEGVHDQRMRGRYERMDQQRGPLQLGYPAEAHETGLVAVSCGHSMHLSLIHI